MTIAKRKESPYLIRLVRLMSYEECLKLDGPLTEEEWLDMPGVGPETVKALARVGMVKDVFLALPKSIRNHLHKNGITTIDEAKRALESAEIDSRGFGVQSRARLSDFLSRR